MTHLSGFNMSWISYLTYYSFGLHSQVNTHNSNSSSFTTSFIGHAKAEINCISIQIIQATHDYLYIYFLGHRMRLVFCLYICSVKPILYTDNLHYGILKMSDSIISVSLGVRTPRGVWSDEVPRWAYSKEIASLSPTGQSIICKRCIDIP